MTGYSGTPLAKKLGIKEGSRVVLMQAPMDYRKMLEPLPAAVVFASKLATDIALVQVFATAKADLAKALANCRKQLASDAVVWVSWPKKAAKVPTDITEDVIRELALPLGFVDIKVCAVDEVWSGLKLMVRKELR